MLDTNTTRIFISYKREDEAEAKTLCRLLQDWGFATWLDLNDIPPGLGQDSPGWMQAILQGIKSCQIMIGLLAKKSLDSEVVLGEWQSARDNKLHIVHLRIDNVAPADIPPPFNLAQYIDLVKDRPAGLDRLKDHLRHYQQTRNAAQMVTAAATAVPPATARRVDRTPIGSKNEALDRRQMLERVQQYWVEGALYPALRDVQKLRIGVGSKPEAVLKHHSFGDFQLHDSGNIRHIFDVMESVLILGDPGAGKTIMLLQLAESLIQDALAQPEKHKRMPVVFNLSSWSLKPRPLEDWLLDELQQRYQVKAACARRWLDNNQLIFLLDGLDEVKMEVRADCAKAINEFRQAQEKIGLTLLMVVCSRIADYELLPDDLKLDLKGAVVLEGLTQEQIDAYLSHPKLAGLRAILPDDPTLRDMTSTPFLLNIMAFAYADDPPEKLVGYPTEVERRRHLLNRYVERRLDEGQSPYTKQQTIQYLEWLATKMYASVQTVFRLEDIQPMWLEDNPRGRRLYLIALNIITYGWFPLIFGITGVIAAGMLGAISFAVVGLYVGLALMNSLASPEYAFTTALIPIDPTRRLRPSWRRLRDVLAGINFEPNSDQVIVGIIIFIGMLAFATPLTLALSALPLLLKILLIGLPLGLLSTWAFAYMGDKKARIMITGNKSHLGNKKYSKYTIRNIRNLTLRDFGFALLGALLLAIHPMAFYWSIAEIIPLSPIGQGLINLGITAVVTVFLVSLTQPDENSLTTRDTGLATEMVSSKATFIGLAVSIGFGLMGYALHGPAFGITLGLAVGTSIALPFGAFFGLQRLLVRTSLLLGRSSPADINSFLQTMERTHMLRSIGGGHVFVHRTLLEHFARVDEAIATLVEQLGVSETREYSTTQLRKLGAIALLGLIEGLFHARPVVRRNAATLLGELEDARAVDPFIQALRDPDYEVRRAADKALVSIGEPSVEPLIRALRDPDTNVRSAAASALGELKDARAVEPFIQALRDPEWWVRQRAASALGELKDTRAVEPLIQGLQDTSVYVQRAAVWALGELKNTRAIKPLAQLLADETSPPLERRRICDYAAIALREIGTPEALEELRKWGGTIIED